MSRFAVGVMAKAPIPGFAKTRLIPRLGAEGAAALQARLTLNALNTARAATPEVVLFTAGDAAHPFWAQCPPVAKVAQVEGDLGQRMAAALETLLARCPRALLIGSDCPALQPGHLEAAAEALEQAPFVFIPAEDGGYVLVGSQRVAHGVFRGIAWGSDQVMTQTRERLLTEGLDWQELDPLWDLDTEADWERSRALGMASADSSRP